MRISLIRPGLFLFTHVSLCKIPFGQGRVMQDDAEKSNESLGSSFGRSLSAQIQFEQNERTDRSRSRRTERAGPLSSSCGRFDAEPASIR